MDSYQEKIALLQEMIAFALVDGELHDREYDFLEIVSKELEIEKGARPPQEDTPPLYDTE